MAKYFQETMPNLMICDNNQFFNNNHRFQYDDNDNKDDELNCEKSEWIEEYENNVWLEDNTKEVRNKKIKIKDNISENLTQNNEKLMMMACDRQFIPHVWSNIIDNFIRPDMRNKLCEPSSSLKPKLVIKRVSDLVNKLHLRIKLKKNFDHVEIKKILDLLSDSSAELEIGGASIMHIPKMLYNFILCEKFGTSIDKFIPSEFYEKYTKEELTYMTFQTHENKIEMSQKYFTEDIDAVYLDIPLLFDKFGYDQPIKLICLQYHQICVNLDNINKEIYNYIENLNIISDEIIYLDNEPRQYQARNGHELLTLSTKSESYQNFTNTELIIDKSQMTNTKFIFVIIKQNDNTLDNTLDNILPNIFNITIETESGQIIDVHDVDFTNYGKYKLYVISPDQYCDIHNWQNFQKENKNLNTIFDINKKDIKIENNFEYKIANVNRIQMIFEEYQNPIDIEIMYASQNLLRMINGICGLALG